MTTIKRGDYTIDEKQKTAMLLTKKRQYLYATPVGVRSPEYLK